MKQMLPWGIDPADPGSPSMDTGESAVRQAALSGEISQDDPVPSALTQLDTVWVEGTSPAQVQHSSPQPVNTQGENPTDFPDSPPPLESLDRGDKATTPTVLLALGDYGSEDDAEDHGEDPIA